MEPERAPSIAVNMEMGHQDHKRISSNKSNEVSLIQQQFNQFLMHSARMLLWTKQTELHSIANQPFYVEVGDRNGHQRIVRFALHWVRNVIIVACSIILQRYVGNNRKFLKLPNKINASIILKIRRTQNSYKIER